MHGHIDEKVDYEGTIIDKRVGGENRESFVELKDCIQLNDRGEIVAKDDKKRLIDAFIEGCDITEKTERPLSPELAKAQAGKNGQGESNDASAGTTGMMPMSMGMGGMMPMAMVGMMPMGMGMPMAMMPMGMGAMPMGMMQMGMNPGMMGMQMPCGGMQGCPQGGAMPTAGMGMAPPQGMMAGPCGGEPGAAAGAGPCGAAP